MARQETGVADVMACDMWAFHPLLTVWYSQRIDEKISYEEWRVISIVIKHKVDEDVARYRRDLVKSWRG